MDNSLVENTEDFRYPEIGEFYSDYEGHPVKCTFSDGAFVEGISLIDGTSPRECGLFIFWPKRISEEEANKLIEIYKTSGKIALLKANGFDDKYIEDLEKYPF